MGKKWRKYQVMKSCYVNGNMKGNGEKVIEKENTVESKIEKEEKRKNKKKMKKKKG